MIEIEHVSKWYGSFQVLADCTTQVRKGEVVVVCAQIVEDGAKEAFFGQPEQRSDRARQSLSKILAL